MMRMKVFLDNERMKNVTEVNTKEGYIIRHKLDENGKFIRDGSFHLTERVEGNVSVEITGMTMRD